MKLSIFIFLSLLTQVTKAQVTPSQLEQDPVFNAVLSRSINYPPQAERQGVYAKVYVGFRINHEGHVQDVSILNPTRIGYGFEEAVANRLKRLPPLHPRNEGVYALPVTFAYIDYANGAKILRPSGSLAQWFVANRTLLPELTVLSQNTIGRSGKYVPLTVGQVLAVYP